MRNVLFGIAVMTILLIVTAIVLIAPWTFLPTDQKTKDDIEGIRPLKKSVTNVIIVHGIGAHCIGYSDSLLLSIVKQISNSEVEPIKESYLRYLAQLQKSPPKEEVTAVQDGYQIDTTAAPRDGHCKQILSEREASALNLNTDDDSESVVTAQDRVCQFINETTEKLLEGIRPARVPTAEGEPIRKGTPDVIANCHKLYVNRAQTKYVGENPEYVTGFVRDVAVKITAGRTLRIYEITWSPATRWIKDELESIERYNQRVSAHWLNRYIKREVMNRGMADAIAYLANGGVLVNFNILQAFCLVFANTEGEVSDYPFACESAHLQRADKDFASKNDIFLISHSLGTRVLFDTVGLLAMGVDGEGPSPEESRMDLISVMASKLENIGAEVPKEYSRPEFRELLKKQIPSFAKAVRSVFVFTNQLPLLAADISSPFQRTTDVARGFAKFLELRNGDVDQQLQIVAFHDPDDILSYNLSCWYRVMILKYLGSTKEVLEKEALYRAGKEGGDKKKQGVERRKLRDKLFAETCSRDDIGDARDKQVWNEIVEADRSGVRLVDATVRLKGFRIGTLAANPLHVHSNYFNDERVHRWLIDGN